MNTRHRVLKRAVVGIAVGLGLFVSTSGAAGAVPATKVTLTFQHVEVQFTDCPSTPPQSDVQCTGAGVQATSIDSLVGSVHHKRTFIDVALVHVTVHPDGSFDIDETPYASGEGKGSITQLDPRTKRLTGTVGLDDGSRTSISVVLAGFGTPDRFHDSFTDSVPDCPSGQANLTASVVVRQANAFGSLAIDGGAPMPTTTAVQQPFYVDETDTGTCT